MSNKHIAVGVLMAVVVLVPAHAAVTISTAATRNISVGKVSVVYAFCGQNNCTDGSNPKARLTNVGGALFGTTDMGGAYNYGTVFTLEPASGLETV